MLYLLMGIVLVLILTVKFKLGFINSIVTVLIMFIAITTQLYVIAYILTILFLIYLLLKIIK